MNKLFCTFVFIVVSVVNATSPDGLKFLEENAKNDDVVVLPSGLQYKVIKGWTEAMQLMVEGDKFELYIPSELAYGERGSPPKIPGGAALIFTIEMIKIKGDKVPALNCDAETLDNCNEKESKYISKKLDKAKQGGSQTLHKEIKRLEKMKATSEPMSEKNKLWINQRLHILPQLASIVGKDDEL
eukprot:g2355.t1